MNLGRTVFSQLLDFLPNYSFQVCVDRYQGDRYVKEFSCWDQFLCLAFAQLAYRESLRDIEACLRSQRAKLYHMGFRGRISRNTLAHANQKRDWRIFADFARVLITQARQMYRDEPFQVELDQAVYVLDSTTIDLCLSLFPWGAVSPPQSAVKLHTVLDLRGNIPTNVYVTSGAVHDVRILDQLRLEAGAFYLLDRGYLISHGSTLSNKVAPSSSHAPSATPNSGGATGARCPLCERSALRSDHSAHRPPDRAVVSRSVAAHPLFRLRERSAADFSDQQFPSARPHHRRLVSRTLGRGAVLSLDQAASSYPIVSSALRRTRVKTQIWVAITVYVLVAIVKRQFQLEISLYKILQILSITLFEKTPLLQGFSQVADDFEDSAPRTQLNLFHL